MKGAAVPDFKKCYRIVDGLEIIFSNRDTIYVTELGGGRKICYNRWFYHPRGSYRNWREFVKALKVRVHLDIGYITSMAVRYEINIVSVIRIPAITEEFEKIK